MTSGNEFEAHRSFLIKLAYRLLGEVGDAEDMVQETYLRWHSTDEPSLRNPRAWLTTTCTRLCIDRMRSMQARRDEYVGEWLPEPFFDADPEPEIDESISMALLVTMQKLKPAERAVFLLHDVFGYKFDEVGAILDLASANCRQLAVRARRHLDEIPRRIQQTEAQVVELSRAFFAAVKSGDLEQLQATLADDVIFRSDGGGKASAARVPIVGIEPVARFLFGVLTAAHKQGGVTLKAMHFNGAPGVVLSQEGAPVSAFQFVVRASKIISIHVQRNPDKLARIAAL